MSSVTYIRIGRVGVVHLAPPDLQATQRVWHGYKYTSMATFIDFCCIVFGGCRIVYMDVLDTSRWSMRLEGAGSFSEASTLCGIIEPELYFVGRVRKLLWPKPYKAVYDPERLWLVDYSPNRNRNTRLDSLCHEPIVFGYYRCSQSRGRPSSLQHQDLDIAYPES